jgi:hypothetical protein
MAVAPPRFLYGSYLKTRPYKVGKEIALLFPLRVVRAIETGMSLPNTADSTTGSGIPGGGGYTIDSGNRLEPMLPVDSNCRSRAVVQKKRANNTSSPFGGGTLAVSFFVCRW